MRLVRFGVAIILSALVGCVGGPGPLPGGQTDDPPPAEGGNPTTPPGKKGSPGQSDGSGRDPGDDGSGSGSSRISAASFDRTCTSDEECVAVYEGPVCLAACGCANAAISLQALQEYGSRLASLAESCSDQVDCENVNCPAVAPTCSSGVCTLE